MTAPKNLGALQSEISENIEFLDEKPFSHNIISICLG